MSRLLLCTDLDRTLLPNGRAPESAHARELFCRLASQPEVTVVYVTGRDTELVDQAIVEWCIPEPDFLICDVGATIAERSDDVWRRWSRWDALLGPDWAGWSAKALQELLAQIPDLTLQEGSRQNIYKVSWYTPPEIEVAALISSVKRCIEAAGIRSQVIWSLDEPGEVGLLDILPASASKRQALDFLMNEKDFDRSEVVFAGDSGNDMDVLVSVLPAVLVANASPETQAEALRLASEAGQEATLYLARGEVLGMNGNYAAGILEGVLHYHPDWIGLLEGRA